MSDIQEKGPRPYHESQFTTPVGRLKWPHQRGEHRSELARELAARGWLMLRPADWVEPQYPGDTMMRLDLERGNEIGTIRIQWYGNGMKPCVGDNLKVGSFTPGVEECSPGDTPKFWPNKDTWVTDKAAATRIFWVYLAEALNDGWRIEK